jgi:hypothetical protein
VLWTCNSDGKGETGEDCAAEGKLCVSGICANACSASGTCAAGSSCDSSAKACIPSQSCTTDSQCDTSRGEGCFQGVCVIKPTQAGAAVSCYPAANRPAYEFTGTVLRLKGGGTAANGTLLGADLPFTSDANGTFTNAFQIEADTTPAVRFTGPTGLAPGLHFGPEMQGGEELVLLTMLTADLATLVGTEKPAAGPGYTIAGRGVVAGLVRDCNAGPLSLATVGYSVPVGRQGYLGAVELQRQGLAATTQGLFVAFDAPIGVDFKVVVVALKNVGGVNQPVVVSAQQVRIEPPPKGADYGLTLVSAGRGAHH